MKTLSLSEAKMKLSALIEDLGITEEQVVITKNGAPAAILVSPREFESWQETIAVKSDVELMDEIRSGLRDLESKNSSIYTLEELMAD